MVRTSRLGIIERRQILLEVANRAMMLANEKENCEESAWASAASSPSAVDEQDTVAVLDFLRGLLRHGKLRAPFANQKETHRAHRRHCHDSGDDDGPWVRAQVLVPKECVDDYESD